MIFKKSQTVSSSVILYIMKENFSNDYFSKDLNLDVQMWKKKSALELMKYSLWSNLEDEILDSFCLHVER